MYTYVDIICDIIVLCVYIYMYIHTEGGILTCSKVYIIQWVILISTAFVPVKPSCLRLAQLLFPYIDFGLLNV